VVRAKQVYPVAADPIAAGMVLIRDGKIAAVGADLEVPADAKRIEIPDGVVTPGLIDAACLLDFGVVQVGPPRRRGRFWKALAENLQAEKDHEQTCPCSGALHDLEALDSEALGPSPSLTWAEHSAEVIPHLHVLDSVDFWAQDFRRLYKGGVTTVFVTPDSASVIGSRGAVVKTGGPLALRVVRKAGAVKATIGSDPSRRGRRNYLPPRRGPAPTFHTRRPTTRMGVDWVFRKAFLDARRDGAGLPLRGADVPPREALPLLRDILDGRIPLRIQARMQHDILWAIKLAAEFELTFTLEEAIEAYQCLPQIKAAKLPVIFGPIFITPGGYRRFTGEANDPRLSTAALLRDAGIRFALTAGDMRDEEGLARQAMCAIRYGLTPKEALDAVTATPAALLELSDRIGALQVGLDADLVIWSGEPFAATSRVLLVMINGEVVYEE
jgi:imidazolonepropionase-like amidohydrolase